MKTDKFLKSTSNDTHSTIILDSHHKNSELWQTYQAKKSEFGMLFPTEGAKLLGVSEFELLLSSPHSRYLGVNCRELLGELHTLGTVESIVRNEFCVHEKTGNYTNLKLGDIMGLSLDDGMGSLDLRIFLNHWKHALAVINPDGKNPSYSIQFYDGLGQAINKVFLLTIEQSLPAFETLCEKYSKNAPNQIELKSILPQNDWIYQPLPTDKLQEFHQDWQAMTDIHQFHTILTKYELDRPSSFVQAPQHCAKKLNPKLLTVLFDKLAESSIPVMIFVGNTGIVQIHCAPLYNIKSMNGWLNILDDKKTNFSMHLKDDAIAHLWLIKRPNGKDGDTLAIEGFDKKGNSILTLFGERTEGKAQDTNWQAFIQELAEHYSIDNTV